jgi:Zn-dependent peptidase ImmA (M78 family)
MTWIKEIIEGLIDIYKTRNVYEIVELLDIKLIKKELKPEIKGRFLRDMFDNEYIYISNELSEEEEKIVIAHELGHAILHTYDTMAIKELSCLLGVSEKLIELKFGRFLDIQYTYLENEADLVAESLNNYF